MDERIKVVIDADFFRNITEYERGVGLFLRVMEDLNMKPAMHEFVANVELKGNVYLQQLLDIGKIWVASYKDYLKEEDKIEYAEYFMEAYERVNHFEFPKAGDIYKYAERDESLGEIRSLYMARKLGYIYFMSDDADAKMLAKNFFSSKKEVKVKSLFDAFFMCKERNTNLQWKDINPTVTNAMRKRQDKVDKLKEITVYREAQKIAGVSNEPFDTNYFALFHRNRGVTLLVALAIKILGNHLYSFSFF